MRSKNPRRWTQRQSGVRNLFDEFAVQRHFEGSVVVCRFQFDCHYSLGSLPHTRQREFKKIVT